MEKGLLFRIVSMLMVFVLMVNIMVPGIQVNAAEWIHYNSGSNSNNEWKSSARENKNALPDYATGKAGKLRIPDIGLESSKADCAVKGSKISVLKSDDMLEISPKSGSFENAAYTNCAVRYTNVHEGVDYQFASLGSEKRVSVFYEGYSNTNNLEFDVSHSAGLELKPEDGNIILYKDETPVFAISAPVMKDTSGSVGKAGLSVSEEGTLILNVDKEWLSDLSRAYPVSISFSAGEYESITAKVRPRKTGTAPNPNGIMMFQAAADCPFDYWVDVSYGTYGQPNYGYMTVNSVKVTSAEGITPPAAGTEMSLKITDAKTGAELETIDSYVLNVPINYAFETGKFYQLYMIVDGEEIELDHFLIYEVTGQLKHGVAFIGYKYNMEDPTDLVKDNDLDETKNLIQAGSTVFIRNPELSKNPQMPIGTPTEKELAATVSWLLGKGAANICEFGLEPINYNTGNFLFSANDLTLPDYTGEFTFDRTYNSIGSKQNGAFGYGWKFKYDISLSVRDGGICVLNLGDGRTVWLSWDGSKYTGDDGKYYTLTKIGNGYSVTNTQDKTIYKFNWNGELTSIADAGGNTTNFTQTNHQMVQLKTPAGDVVEIKWDTEDHITALKLPGDKWIHYEYDVYGNLKSVTDQEGRTTAYSYDNAHRLISVTNPEGTVTVKNTYDSEDRVISQLDGNGNEATLVYETGKTTVTDNNGNKTQVFFDNVGRTTKVIHPDSSTELKTWDDANNMTSYTDTYGVTTRYEYNAFGLVTKETRSDGAIAKYEYNSRNKVTSYTDFEGNITKYEYDPKSNLTKVIYADGGEVEYAYNDKNQVISVTDQLENTIKFEYTGALCTAFVDALGNRTEYGYSTLGWLTSVEDAAGNVTRYLCNACGERYAEQRPDGSVYTYIYDDAGYVTAIQDELGYISEFSYDEQGNMLQGIDPMGNTLTMTYDKNYNKLTSTDALGRKTAYAYDNMDRVKTVTDPKGGVTEYTYDAAGNVISVKDPNGNIATLTYDKVLGLTTTVTEPGDSTTSFAYDKMGNVVKVTYADGGFETFEYDGMNRVSKATSVLGLVTEYTYDKAGNLTKVSNSQGQEYLYTYDANGNILTSTDARGNKTTYGYNELGQVVSMTDPLENTTTYVYDSMGRMISSTDAQENRSTYEYDLRGNLTAVVDALGNRTEQYYNELGKLVATKDALGNITTYEYDKVEQLTATVDALTNRSELTYDNNGNITKIKEANGAETILSYDANGNNTKIVDAEDYVTEISYDYADQVIKSIAPTGLAKDFTYNAMHWVTKAADSTDGTMEYTYDYAGNVLTEKDATGRVASYTYDKLGRLTAYTGFDGASHSYTYDADGRLLSETRPDGAVTAYTYDKAGNLTQVLEPSGGKTVYTYDSLNRVSSVTDAEGGVTKYDYDALGNIIKVTDANGKETSINYDALSRMTKIIAANTATTQYGYDAIGRIVTETTPLGSTLEYAYDEVGNLTGYKDAEGYVSLFEYDLVGNQTKSTDPRGAVTEYSYNSAGLLTKQIDALNNATTFTYTADGLLTGKELPNGAKYGYSYDVLDRLTGLTAPEGLSRTFQYDKAGDIVSETDQSDRKTEYVYDILHQMTAVTNPAGMDTIFTYDISGNLTGTESARGAKTSYTYDLLNRQVSSIDPAGLLTEYTYDKVGHPVSVTQNNSRTTRYSYDSVYNLTGITDPLGQKTSLSYDKENRVTAVADPMGFVTRYGYSKNGNLVSETDRLGAKISYTYDANSNLTSITDKENRKVSYTYDNLNCLTSVTEPGNIVTMYTYDSVGNLTSQTDAAGKTTKFTYNLNNQLTSVETPMGYTEELQYNLDGMLETYINPDGRQINYDYDMLDQLVSKVAPSDGEHGIAAFGYDEDGNAISMEDVTGNTDYEYDLAGRLTAVTTAQGGTIRYGYDVYGNITSLTYPDGAVVHYEYDALNRMTKITGRDGNSTAYAYDANSNMVKVTRPNGTFTEIEYDAESRIVKLSNVNENNKIISDFSYTYDKSGCIIEEVARQDGETVTTSYTYDSRKQLASATSVHSDFTLKTEYTYDKAGNRITEEVSKTQWGSTHVVADIKNTYDGNNRLIKQTNSADSWTRSITYQYDENGNMVRKSPPNNSYTTYEYDSENRLTAVHDKDALLFAALYDGNGDRVFTLVPRQNTGNWHDDWNDGRWSSGEHQDGYNDSKWTYGEEETDPTEPTTEPTAPVTEPTEPETKPTEPSEPTEPDTKPTEPTKPSDPTEPTGDDGSWEEGKYEGGNTGVDDGQWHPDGETKPTEPAEPTEATDPTEPTPAIPAWDAGKAYNGGAQVTYGGKIYEARWWTLGDIPGAVNEGPWKLISEIPEETEPTEPTEPEPTEPEPTEPEPTEPATEPTEDPKPGDDFEVNGSADYDLDLIRDVLFVPNGVDSPYLEENYVLTGYINDVNTQYTQTLVEYGVSGAYDSVYEYGVQRTTMYQNGQVYSYEYDGRGSVSELVNSLGKTQIKYSYGAYGETISTTIGWNNPVTNPYRYNAERIDDVAGVPAFQYLRARYLNPYTSSFLTQDSYLGNLLVPLSQNRYLYVGGNPVRFVDPSGHTWKDFWNWFPNTIDEWKYNGKVDDIEEITIELARVKIEYDKLGEGTEKTELAEYFAELLEERKQLCGEAMKLRAKMAERGKTDYKDLPDPLIFTLDSIEIRTTTPLIRQDTDAYCWVASALMLMATKDLRLLDERWKNTFSQKEIAKKILDAEIDNDGNILDENNNPQFVTNGDDEKMPKMAFGSIDLLKKALDHINDASGNSYDFNIRDTLTEDELRAYLLNNYPVAIGLDRYTLTESGDADKRLVSHAVVIVGYNSETNRYLIQNPTNSSDNSVYELTYKELIERKNYIKDDVSGDQVKDLELWYASVVFDADILDWYNPYQ